MAFVTAEEIDEMDILNARMLAMNRAIDGLIHCGRTCASSTATGTTAAPWPSRRPTGA